MEEEEENDNLRTENEEIFPGFSDVASYTKNLLGATLKATKSSNKIPSCGEQYDFYNTFSGFRQLMKAEAKTVLNLMTRILHHQGGKGNFENADLDDKFDLLVDANDTLMERAGMALDEASGIKKKEEAIITTVKFTKPINTSWNKKTSPMPEAISLLAAKNVTRPQLKFVQKIDNSNSPFVPGIKDKPHSIKPLSILLELDENGQEVYSHPYELEIEKFQPTEDNLQRVQPQLPRKIEDTELVFVSNTADLRKLCSDLCQVSEFAVDLENHSYRSFQGMTCLMQISTRDCDYLVDTLELRNELHQLNEIFTNPKITKVLHGADMDVQWLQRDFGVYLVNLFDTGQAARVLSYSHFSLAFLLKHFCQVNPDKSFQLADWRIRPLTEKMVLYAREDTHYLLYIYDCMKNELLEKGNVQNNLLHSVIQRSKQVCLKRYQKPLHREDSYLNLYQKSRKRFNTRQLYALKEIFAWRDKLARQEDESYGFVLPNHMMLQISEMLPREQQGILASCNPVPPMVKQQLNELHLIILKAREWNEQKLSVPASHLEVSESQAPCLEKMETSLSCPHDLPHQEELSSLPTLINDDVKCVLTLPTSARLKTTPGLTAYSVQRNLQEKTNLETSTTMKTKFVQRFLDQMISPFQRFKLAQSHPIVHSQEEVEAKSVTIQASSGSEHVERVHEHFKTLITCAQGSRDSESAIPTQNYPEKMSNEQEELEEDEDGASLIHQIPRKRKRKSQRPVPHIPLSIQSQPQVQQQIKQFQSFDYEKARETLFRDRNNASTSNERKPWNEKKDRKRTFDPNDNYFKNKRGKFSHKHRGAKSMTYGPKSNSSNSRQWPKR